MENIDHDLKKLFETVVKGGYCIGCGVCASRPDSPIDIEFDDYMQLQATLKSTKSQNKLNESVLEICPFSENSDDEDEISAKLFKDNTSGFDKNIGYYLENYAGHVIEDNYRENGSSGGIVTWILKELMISKEIDAVIHVKNNRQLSNDSRLFEYGISNNIEEISNSSKTRYYPIELSKVLKKIRNRNGKYAIVGLPCFIKAIRLLSEKDCVIKERIKYCIGLVCGQLKSANFANMWAWQVGVNPAEIRDIDFRLKIKDEAANNYGVMVEGLINGDYTKIESKPLNKNYYGNNWGWGLFKYKACDYCDDVVAETADVTVGDAWLPKYIGDHKGNNIVIVRERNILRIIQEGIKRQKVLLEKVTHKEIVSSQNAGFNHRRKEIGYRLQLAKKSNLWYPPKRRKSLKFPNYLKRRRKKIQRLRIIIRTKSHSGFTSALKTKSFEVFRESLAPFVNEYNKIYKSSKFTVLAVRIKRIIKKIIMKLN
jgi:coenzyme F420 hydrogenase subunit beta